MAHRLRPTWMAALAGAAILLAACGPAAPASAPLESARGPTGAAGQGALETAVTAVPAPPRPLAPGFDLATLGGGRFNLADHRGEVVVFYSGSLCAT